MERKRAIHASLLALAAAGACSPIPPPRFDAGAAPEMCPAVYTATTVPLLDDRCVFERCPIAVEQHGCALSLLTPACMRTRLDGTVDAAGRANLKTPDGKLSCAGSAFPPSIP